MDHPRNTAARGTPLHDRSTEVSRRRRVESTVRTTVRKRPMTAEVGGADPLQAWQIDGHALGVASLPAMPWVYPELWARG